MIPAGFWKRVAAYFIDIFFILILAIPITIFYLPNLQPLFHAFHVSYQEALISGNTDETSRDLAALLYQISTVFSPVLMIVEILYFSLQEASRHQATLGKRVMRIKVVNRKGQRLSLLQAVARTLAKYLSGFVFFGIGYLMAAFTRRKQALHDLITDSFVVNSDSTHTFDKNADTQMDDHSNNSTFVG